MNCEKSLVTCIDIKILVKEFKYLALFIWLIDDNFGEYWCPMLSTTDHLGDSNRQTNMKIVVECSKVSNI